MGDPRETNSGPDHSDAENEAVGRFSLFYGSMAQLSASSQIMRGDLDPKDIYESDPTGDFGISWAEYYLIMQRIMARTIYPGETDKMGLSLMNYLECVDFDNYTIEDDEDGIGQKCRIAMRKQIEGMTSIRDAFKDSFPHPKASIETEGAINFQAIYPRILAGYEDREGINEMGLPIRFAGCPSYVLEGYIHLMEFTLSMAGEWKPGLED